MDRIKIKNRIGNWVLLIFMSIISVSLCAQSVWDGSVASAYSGGTGTSSSPYIISNGGQLALLAQSVNRGNAYANTYFQLDQDIDLGGVKWTSIGKDADNQFKGKFNGNGRLIANLYVNDEEENVGLFGYIGSGGEIQKVGVVGTSLVIGVKNAGGIAGRNNGNIINCYSMVNVEAAHDESASEVGVGGLVGYNNGNVSGCYSVGRVAGKITGGICGYDVTTTLNIKDCFFDNQVCTVSRAVGTKQNNDNCGGKTTMEMTTGLQWTLGFSRSVWYLYYGLYPQFQGRENDDISKVSVSPIFLTAGQNVDAVKNSFTVSTVNGCIWKTTADTPYLTIEEGNATVVRPEGMNDTVDLVCSLNGAFKSVRVVIQKVKCSVRVFVEGDGVVMFESKVIANGESIVVEDGGAISITMKPSDDCFLSKLMFRKSEVRPMSNYAAMNLIYSTPTVNSDADVRVYFEKCSIWKGNLVQPFDDISGNKILIYRPEELAYLSQSVTQDSDHTGVAVKLVNNIDLGGSVAEDKPIWKPIGMPDGQNNISQFNGRFDGNYKKISNIYSYMTSKYYVGLFGIVGVDGVIENVMIESGEVSGLGWTGSVGGENRGLIKNCSNKSNISSSDKNSGGIVGFNNGGTVEYCQNYGNVKGRTDVGGVVGYSYSGNVKNCANLGNVESTISSAGGIVGRDNSKSRTIYKCSNTGSVKGRDYVGGVVGKNMGAMISWCNNRGRIDGNTSVGGVAGELSGGSLSISYNTGDVYGKEKVGGLVGDNYARYIDACYNEGAIEGNSEVGGLVGYNEGKVVNCYNTKDVAGTNFIGGIVGKSTANSEISFCYTIGCVADGSNMGMITGSNYEGTFMLQECVYDKETCVNAQACPNGDVKDVAFGMTHSELMGVYTRFNSLQNSNPWKPGDGLNNGYPILYWQSAWSVEGVANVDYKVYPNPTKGIVNIDGDDISTVFVCNIAGQVLHTFNSYEFGNKISLNISDLKSGIYLLNVINREGVSCTKKIIKQ